MTTSLGKRSSTNGISDIAYKDEKAPVYTSTNQFVQGTKTYNDPQKFLSNVLCSGYYYGDGSHLTNLSVPTLDQVCTSGNITNKDIYLVSGNDSVHFSTTQIECSSGAYLALLDSHRLAVIDGNNGKNSLINTDITLTDGGNNTTTIQPLAVDLSVDGGPQTTQLRIDYLRFTDDNTLDGTICHVGAIVDNSAAGLLVNTGSNIGQPCHVLAGFEGSAGQEPKLQLRNASDGAIVEVKHTGFRVQSDQLSYRFYNDTKVFKWDAGTSYRVRADNGDKINVDDAIVVSNFNNINFKNYTEYLDANGQGGFMFYLCNPGNLPDPFVQSPDIYFVGGQIGGVQNGFTLPKWTSARFILTPTDSACGYPYDFIWLVSW